MGHRCILYLSTCWRQNRCSCCWLHPSHPSCNTQSDRQPQFSKTKGSNAGLLVEVTPYTPADFTFAAGIIESNSSTREKCEDNKEPCLAHFHNNLHTSSCGQPTGQSQSSQSGPRAQAYSLDSCLHYDHSHSDSPPPDRYIVFLTFF